MADIITKKFIIITILVGVLFIIGVIIALSFWKSTNTNSNVTDKEAKELSIEKYLLDKEKDAYLRSSDSKFFCAVEILWEHDLTNTEKVVYAPNSCASVVLVNGDLRGESGGGNPPLFKMEYNIFEYQAALIQRNVAKAQKIAFYLADNTKQNPLPIMLATLFGTFSKVLMVHDSGSLSDGELAKQIGVNPYFVRDYVTAKRNYPLAKVVRMLEAIKNADLKFKGILGAAETDRDILLDLSFELLHL